LAGWAFASKLIMLNTIKTYSQGANHLFAGEMPVFFLRKKYFIGVDEFLLTMLISKVIFKPFGVLHTMKKKLT
jgi:hypothetical protein